jgi:hypothetical protein
VSKTLERVRALVSRDEVRVSLHGSEELSADSIRVRDVIAGLTAAVLVEDYPSYPKGPCVLVLEHDSEGRPLHIVWGIPAGQSTPAVLITGYRPDASRWDDTWLRRRR